MADRTLSVWHVASLLVSTSCGIGFLLGTGELALHQGMAACLYAVATAAGLVALAWAAPHFWKTGQSVWAYFRMLYGPTVSHPIALLSLIWMTGVLSAQIRGASSILALSGMPHTASIITIDCLVIGLSFMRLSWLSSLFAFCMCGCSVVLAYVLIKAHSLTAWVHAPASFVQSIRAQPDVHVELTLLSVIAMVVFGADYQQFPIEARTPTGARLGCLIAAVIVFSVGFLPASAVITSASVWHLGTLPDPVQAVPQLLILSLPTFGHIAAVTVVLVLLTTALGSACSILRAMTDATAALPYGSQLPSVIHRTLPVCAATLVAVHGQSMINIMITLNIVYLAAAAPLLGLTLFGLQISDRAARRSMFTGLIIVSTCLLIECTHTIHMPESITLAIAWPCALTVALRSRISANASNYSGTRASCWTNTHLNNHSAASPSSDSDIARSSG
jgi:SSS family solute:Na+ symporter